MLHGQTTLSLPPPFFPIICKIGAELVCGDTLQQFERRLKKFDLVTEETFSPVDASGEGWSLVPKISAISPLTFDKRGSKNRIVEMFDASASAERARLRYPYRSLGSRPIEVVVRDVAALLNYADKIAPNRAPQTHRQRNELMAKIPSRMIRYEIPLVYVTETVHLVSGMDDVISSRIRSSEVEF